jgi:hypothetical protein
VSNLGKRVGLIHELRQLAAAEELSNRGHHRLGVDKVVRHGCRHFLMDRHLLFDRPLHADQADAELVLEQFSDGPNPAISQVINIIHAADIFRQLERVLYDRIEIICRQRALLERCIESQFDIEFEPADFREVILARIVEHSFKQSCGCIQR